ncbi:MULTISPECIES: nucleotide 5'-monophosphate nucleosidase PpnN [unclassified Oceanobacter]|jgi:predicted Rossmann-fold nucleotide-binding protein|uniref:nucleotide 5'-monophosphate nucleosidase PpnN n=1 Tax=unclassified Oceanobacter TaxID=2620260 RepID=UPI0026E47221|nr:MULTISPECIES: nucleotide 5'-monophosphate nucleosidase PpnN [unclassified Oceanobacter]MDO6681649.1 nucleotide 5'-monophosphate nucleosidase PpnN [Oceanobacter sp. 5_MG-2023]MDP2505723.1 nucleotide 5'-monophosphate nucleosidase PpnN [Oceanobacter sp. 3_MG-2023]MDP2547450.1 nucleotide 5'-monophosphate nucleosidase PpnN [Oceanobacter sp. 4_MG-2023]MDP2608238.1 nucleotide 5'-monophosphate nucleosidase PpnN [Oceanobacter sp. 1_MG-2023]MDP2612123.1 nucleotide 5'-monophosphate nucleosidase PpnN [
MSSYELIHPKTHLRVLSRYEIQQLRDVSSQEHDLVRRCCYAVLNAGSQSDSYIDMEAAYQPFDIHFEQEDRGLVLRLVNPPPSAFVDNDIIRGVREQLFSVLRDVLYAQDSIIKPQRFDLNDSDGITNAIFHLLRNADVLCADRLPNLVVCWGGHSIPRNEYKYCKEVGYHLGLRGLDIGTGCGPGAMKGPMKGATIGHAKQHNRDGRYIGITEPGIIATEAPNPIVNELVILPDIEKRLEAFVRMAHGIVIFPGGPGTAEELLYLLGILTHPKNITLPFPVIITGPEESGDYLRAIDRFIGTTLGAPAQARYQLIINDAQAVAQAMKTGIHSVQLWRQQQKDAYFFNWSLHIPAEFQHPFDPTHKAMSALNLSFDAPGHQLAADLRRAFSGIVAGNVKAAGIQRVQEHGPYQLQGDPKIMEEMNALLAHMVASGRMKMTGEYTPCYEITTADDAVQNDR